MKLCVRSLVLVAAFAANVFAQRDTSATPLNTVVVTAERTRSVLGSSTSSVSRIPVEDLARTPRATIADALRRVPGFALVDFDGLGFDPQLMVRGFYGGGEAEYVVMLVDGRPIAQLQTGIIPWSALPPLSAIESIEVVRGSSSALYGDAAIGGVINIITRRSLVGTPLRVDVSGASYGGWAGNASFVSPKNAAIWAGGERTDGFRTHAERSSVRGGASVPLLTGNTKLHASVGAHRQSYDEPGALLSSLLDEKRDTSDALFRFDHTKDNRVDVGLNAERGRFTGYLSGEWRNTDAIRTLALAPGFGDTKERVTRNARILGSMQFEASGLVVGADVAYNTLDSKYFSIVMGERQDYASAIGDRGEQVVQSEGSRTSGAAFAQYSREPLRRVRLSIGARFDWLSDEVEHLPRRDITTGDQSPSHTAFSPKLGVSVKYMETGRSSGNIYATASKSFKAPTLDQLFDQRPIPLPFPPFTATTSNVQLEPQRGTNMEAGLYHTLMVSPFVVGSVSLSAYQMDMRDEVDFNVETLSYVNIGRSRHRGIEAGMSFSHLGRGTVFANYTLQAATIERGDNAGNQLKAIPRHTTTAGVMVSPSSFKAGLSVNRVSGAFIDDANTIPFDAYTRFDAHASYAIRGVSVFAEARNLFDKKYNTTGFVDPSGSGEIYYYPAAGRVVSAGVRRGW